MFLKSINGNSFSLEVAGYEFPNAQNAYDLNWLLMDVEFNHNDIHFKVIDPCLETADLELLIDFFKEILQYEDVSNIGLGFAEPNLSFEFTDITETTITFNIVLYLELVPYGYEKLEPYFIPMTCYKKDIINWINSLIIQSQSFPERFI